MKGKRTSEETTQLLTQAQALAELRATQWRVWKKDKEGHALAGFHIVEASSAEAAIIQVCDIEGIGRQSASAPTKATPLLGNRSWRAIYAEVGLTE